MAAIRETLILEDKFTSTMTQCLQVAQRMANMPDGIQASMMNVETAVAATVIQMQELAGKMTQTNSQGTSLLGMIRSLAGTFLGTQSVRWLVNASDQSTSTSAWLRLMTGSAEAMVTAQEGIYQAAMRSRGAYADMASFASQPNTVTGNTFTGTDELMAFAGRIRKQMAISEAFGALAQATLMQLTQDLASGTLWDEELNSMLEQTPVIAQTITKYMGVTIREMREPISEGKVTAEVVKNVMLGVAEEISAQFEQMPTTWVQVRTMLQNIAIQALDPVLDAISWLANDIDLMGPITLGLDAAFSVFLLVANWIDICMAVATTLTTAQEMLGVIMVTIWELPLIITALVIEAIYIVTAAVNHFVGTSVSATGIIAGTVLTVAVIIENAVIGLFNGIIQAIWSIFVITFLGIIEWILNITNGGLDLFDGAVANLVGDTISWSLDLGKVMTEITDAIFGTNWIVGLTSL